MSRTPSQNSNGNSTHSRQESLNVEQAVRERYSEAAHLPVVALCCPVDYDDQYLQVLPNELIERDYGCGDPSRHVKLGETVLDLGSGGGKICYIASQVVGPEGRVIGVDRNEDMLALAREFQDQVSENIGHRNVEFRKGSIQDLALDLEKFEAYLAENPVASASDWLRAEARADEMRKSAPMIEDNSVDVVVSNCVLNLVRDEDRRTLFSEIYRVLKPGGRAVISDIVCDEEVPEVLRRNPELWSGCISGAFVEEAFINAFLDAEFYGAEILERQAEPWATVEGIEFRSVTLRAFKGKEGACLDQKQAVIYQGPWKSVTDDDGHILRRGVRTAVCGKTFKIYNREPYSDDILPVEPFEEVPLAAAAEYDCRRNAVRHPRETKGLQYDRTEIPGGGECCGPDCC